VKRLTTGLARSGIGILISLVCVYLALRGVDLGQTAGLMGTVRLPWLCLAVVGISADLVFRALRWQRLIAPIHPVPLGRLSGYMLVGYLANNVLPARLGELVRSHYLGDREGSAEARHSALLSWSEWLTPSSWSESAPPRSSFSTSAALS